MHVLCEAQDCSISCWSQVSCRSSRFPSDMRAGFFIDDGHQFSLGRVIGFVLAIVSTMLLLPRGEWRIWEIEAELLTSEGRRFVLLRGDK